MESIKLSFEAVMPIFLLMLTGYLIKKLKLANKENFEVMNRLIFKVFLPALLFYNIYSTSMTEILNFKLIVFSVVATIVTFIIGYFAVIVLTKENKKRGVMLQGFFRGNFAFIGIPLVDYICKGETSGLASVILAVLIPVFNVLAVVSLERFREGNHKLDILKLIKGILKNPLIISCCIALLFLLLDIKLPHIVEQSVKDISSVATPLAIIVLGAVFEFSDIKGYFKENAIVVMTRLIIVPLIVLPVAVWLGFKGEALACVLAAFASPIAISSYAMAQQMEGDDVLASQLVVLTSTFCLVTLFFWIFGLSYLGLF